MIQSTSKLYLSWCCRVFARLEAFEVCFFEELSSLFILLYLVSFRRLFKEFLPFDLSVCNIAWAASKCFGRHYWKRLCTLSVGLHWNHTIHFLFFLTEECEDRSHFIICDMVYQNVIPSCYLFDILATFLKILSMFEIVNSFIFQLNEKLGGDLTISCELPGHISIFVLNRFASF